MSTVIGRIDTSVFDGDGLEIIGTDEADLLSGTTRDDLILAGAGDDTVRADRGADSIVGGLGDDIILGGSGAEIIEAGAGDDTIFGELGDDYINGDLGDDIIRAGKGADTVVGGAGSDTLFGGGGQDVFEFNIEDFAAEEVDIIADFHVGQDKIVISGLSDGDEVSFDPTTNSIALNGESVIDLGLVDSFRDPVVEDNDDGDYEII